MRDPILGSDKFAHYFLHFWLFVLLQLLLSFWVAAGTCVAFGFLWELKDRYAPSKILRWAWLVKLNGGPYEIGGYGFFSWGDIVANTVGLLTGVWFVGR